MALTATASNSTQQNLFKTLAMKDPLMVCVSPNKANIKYCVRNKKAIDEVFSPVVD